MLHHIIIYLNNLPKFVAFKNTSQKNVYNVKKMWYNV
jgi:hypothetical protein